MRFDWVTHKVLHYTVKDTRGTVVGMAPFRPVRARASPPGLPVITAVPAHMGGEVKTRDIDEECGKALPDVLPTAVAGAGCSCFLYLAPSYA